MPPYSAVLNPDLSRALRFVAAPRQASAVDARARREALALIEGENLAAPAVTYRIAAVTRVNGDAIEVEGAVARAPELAAGPGTLESVAAAACTLGPAIEQRVSALFTLRRRSLALALDAVGNELLFRLADQASAAIRRKARSLGFSCGAEVSPGDPGMTLDQQHTVLALADAARIGIVTGGAGAAGAAAMIAPVKSLSFLIALGRGLRARAAPVRCKACPSRTRCKVK